MRPGTLVDTLVAIAIAIVGATAATNAVRPAIEAAASVSARAVFLADLARLDVLLLEACSRVEHASAAIRLSEEGVVIVPTRARGGPEADAPALRLHGDEAGVTAQAGDARFASTRIRVTDVRIAGEATPCLHVTVGDPARPREEAWVLVAPFAGRSE